MKKHFILVVFVFILSLQAMAVAVAQNNDRHVNNIWDTGTICLQAPVKNIIWQTGTEQRIVWTYDGITGARVDILLLRSNKPPITIASQVEIAKGEYIWEISPGVETGFDYVIKVKSATFPWCFGFSDRFGLKAKD